MRVDKKKMNAIMNTRAGVDEYKYKYKYVSHADRIDRKKANVEFHNLRIFFTKLICPSV